MDREKKTIEAMIKMYCRGFHSGGRELCRDCGALLEYAWQRLRKCPFSGNKPTCAKCPIHCYSAQMRSRIISVMRYSGPRMLFRHPVLALSHLQKQKRREGEWRERL
jgi:hypothetical protein